MSFKYICKMTFFLDKRISTFYNGGGCSAKYLVLSRMARDLFAAPASTVASESALSTSGRVISDYRSRLTSKNVEALICLQDWLRAEGNLLLIV